MIIPVGISLSGGSDYMTHKIVNTYISYEPRMISIIVMPETDTILSSLERGLTLDRVLPRRTETKEAHRHIRVKFKLYQYLEWSVLNVMQLRKRHQTRAFYTTHLEPHPQKRHQTRAFYTIHLEPHPAPKRGTKVSNLPSLN